jgi:hypothetical protein
MRTMRRVSRRLAKFKSRVAPLNKMKPKTIRSFEIGIHNDSLVESPIF